MAKFKIGDKILIKLQYRKNSWYDTIPRIIMHYENTLIQVFPALNDGDKHIDESYMELLDKDINLLFEEFYDQQ